MNSSYNVSTSTLRVMTEQFQSGNRICEVRAQVAIYFPLLSYIILLILCCFVTLFSLQKIELNKEQWSALFEPYLFFEAYKNYLQVDIVAADAVDLLAWKGWVESRLRQLTLKVSILPCNLVADILLSDFCHVF